MENYTIEIGKGLGPIKFGMIKQDITDLAGQPTEQDLYNLSGEEDGFLTETWHFDEEEFSVSFDEEDNWRLTTITTSHMNCNLQGVELMGLSWGEIKEKISLSEFGAYEVEDLSDEQINQKCYSFIECSLNFWFMNDELTEVQWGVFWEDEDTPLWP